MYLVISVGWFTVQIGGECLVRFQLTTTSRKAS